MENGREGLAQGPSEERFAEERVGNGICDLENNMEGHPFPLHIGYYTVKYSLRQ